MTDARTALRAVANPIADALSGDDMAVTIDLDPVAPLPGGYPPRSPLTQLARDLVAPLPVIAVQQLKPVQDWPYTLRRSLQRLDQTTPRDGVPRRLHAEAGAMARTVEKHLGTVRITATIEYGSGAEPGTVGDYFLLITTSHIAQLALMADD